MIILNILLVFITWLLLLWIFDQHKFLNIFEQLAFWFWVALSLFVFELFIQWIVFTQLSLLLPVLSFIIVFWVFFYKQIKNKLFFTEVFTSIKESFKQIRDQFSSAKLWHKWVIILSLVYCLFKVFMVFSINTNMPTFDEDAVAWWDLKTKVFVENKSLVLDKGSPEFMGSALERNIFAPLTDTYFLLWNNDSIIWLTNIISPLVYLCIILLFFWIFLRKTNLLFSSLVPYIFCSLPFIFMHSFWSYFNYISGYFLFVFAFYLSDQILNIVNKDKIISNLLIIFPLAIFSFLDASIRNESLFLMLAIFLLESCLFYYYNKWNFILKKNLNYLFVLVWALFAYISNLIINTISPQLVWAVSTQVWWFSISKFLNNLTNYSIVSSPFSQSFFHSDYNLLYLLFLISIISIIISFKQRKEMFLIFFSTILLLLIFSLILFTNVELLWLLTHFSFIRYTIATIPFLIYIIWYSFYLISINYKWK